MRSGLKKKLFNLFPTNIMHFNLQDQKEFTAFDKIIDDIRYADTSAGGITEGDVRTCYEDDWHEKVRVLPIWDELDALMLSCVSNYCYTQSIEPLIISNSWYTIMNKGSRVHRHRHEDSVVSGTLFLKMPEGSHGLAFVNPTIPYRMRERNNQTNDSNAVVHLQEVKEGDMLIYPSWLEHFVPPISCDDRITISFNTDYPIYREE